MLPQIEFDLESSFRLPVLYSTAKLRCTFFNIKSLEESTGWFGDMLGHS